LSWCWQPDHAARPAFEEILNLFEANLKGCKNFAEKTKRLVEEREVLPDWILDLLAHSEIDRGLPRRHLHGDIMRWHKGNT
jgi:hypothetical protein